MGRRRRRSAAQLAEDPDTYEWTEEDRANAQTTRELFPEACEWAVRQKEALKGGLLRRVTVTLDRETIAWFEAQTGEDGETGGDAVAGTGRTDPAGLCPSPRRPGSPEPERWRPRERCEGGAPDGRITGLPLLFQTGPNFLKSDNPVIRGLIFREFSKNHYIRPRGKINIENENPIFPVVKPSNNPCRAVFQSI